jgi:hypothetical protein
MSEYRRRGKEGGAREGGMKGKTGEKTRERTLGTVRVLVVVRPVVVGVLLREE